MKVDERRWQSGEFRKAIKTVDGLVREGNAYHLREWNEERTRCCVMGEDDQEHWMDGELFGDPADPRLFGYIKEGLALAAQSLHLDGSEENMELVHRFGDMVKLLGTNSRVCSYNRYWIAFDYDPYYEPDKKVVLRTLPWDEFRRFVARHVVLGIPIPQ